MATTDLARTLADIALGPKPAAARKDPPYDGRHTLDWEGVKLSIPYWIANVRDLGDEMPEIALGPVRDWRVVGVAEDRNGTACAIRDAISEAVDVEYRSARVDDPADRREAR